MDLFLNKITGGVQSGTNKIEVFNPAFNNNNNNNLSSPPPGGIQWIFRRENLDQNDRMRLGLSINDELRTIPSNNNNNNNNNTLASLHANTLLSQPQRWFVVAVNGRIVESPNDFWNFVSSSLDVRVTLCETAPVDELLMKISNSSSLSPPPSPKNNTGNNNNNNDEDDDEFDFSPTLGPQRSPKNNKNNNNNGEPDYQALLRKDPVRYSFLNNNHPLHNHWEALKLKTIKARDALRQLELQLMQDEEAKKKKAQDDALALLDGDSDSDWSSGSSSSNSEDAASSTNTSSKQNNNNKKTDYHTTRNRFMMNDDAAAGSASSGGGEAHSFFSFGSPEQSGSPASSACASPRNTNSKNNNNVKPIEGAIPLPSIQKPLPPQVNPPFIAYTYRGEQARRAHAGKKR